MKITKFLALTGCLLLNSVVLAKTIKTDVYSTLNNNKLGEILFTDTEYGLKITPNLHDLAEGMHGFHIHQHANCENHGSDAGAHLDPQNTNSHQGPYSNGHLGDLPVLYVDNSGKATTPTLAPRLTTKDILEHAIMIHEGGDNYTNEPALGGGGARIACGKISK